MKIAYKHLLKKIDSQPSIEELSNKLFHLGHEHSINDNIFDLELTPNRGDCLSLNGILRDLSLFYNTNIQSSKEIISDIMSKDLPTVGINESISEAILVMTEKKYGCVIVCNHKNIIIGIITDGDLRRSFKKGLNYLNTCKIKDIMNSKPVMVKENVLVTSAINLMNKKSITSLIVSNKRKPLGIVNLKECTLSV